MGIVKPPFPRIQPGHRLARGLLGAWPFFESGGQTANDAIGNYSGTWNASATPTTPTRVGSDTGTAVFFNGNTNNFSVDLGTKISSSSTAYSCAVRYRSPSADFISGGQYFFDSQAGRTIFSWSLPTVSANLAIYTGTWTAFQASPNDNLFHDVVFVANGTTGTVYLDDSPVTNTITSCPTIGGSVRLGAAYNGLNSSLGGGATASTGELQYLYLWDRALSQDEVNLLRIDPYSMFRHRRILKAGATSQIFGYTNSPMGSIRRIPNIIGY